MSAARGYTARASAGTSAGRSIALGARALATALAAGAAAASLAAGAAAQPTPQQRAQAAPAAAAPSAPNPRDADARRTLEHGDDLSGVWTNQNLPGTADWAIYTFTKDLPALTAAGKARFDAAKPQRGPRGVAVAETDDLVYKCYPPGTPRIYLHPFPMEIIQTPGRVQMLFEYDHLIRQIYTDGRDHRTDLAASWMGDSIGRWEGKTLVVETVNFNDRTWIDRTGVPHSERMKLVERLRLNDKGQLQIDMRVEDPVTLAEPWQFTRYYRKTDWTIEELMCEDNATYTPFEDAILEFDGSKK